jgi:hypothetical protein
MSLRALTHFLHQQTCMNAARNLVDAPLPGIRNATRVNSFEMFRLSDIYVWYWANLSDK